MRHLLHCAVVAASLLAGTALTAQADYQRVVPGKAKTENTTASYFNRLQQYRKAHRTSSNINSQLQEDFGTQYLRVRQRPAASPIRRSAEAPRGNLYGCFTSYNQMTSFDEAFWGRIDMATGDVTPIYYNAGIINYNDYDLQGGVVIDNIFYTTRIETDMVERTTSIYWNRMNLATGEMLTPIPFGQNWGGCAYSVTYDPTTETVHLLSFNAGNDNFVPSYYQIPYSALKKGGMQEPKWIRDIPSDYFLAGLSYCPLDNRIYGFDDGNNVYVLDSAKGEFVKAGSIEYADSFFSEYLGGQVVYSPLDRSFVLYYRNLFEEQMQLVFVDPETLEYTIGTRVGHYGADGRGNITNPFVSVLACMDPFADDEAPEQPKAPVVNLVKTATSGTIDFEVPEYAYSGLKLTTDKVHCLLQIGTDPLFEGDLAPGTKKSVDFSRSEGVYTLKYVCSTGDGKESPETSFKFCVGNDTPEAPKNLRVDGFTLTWDAPERGIYDGYVDFDAMTYNVYFGIEKQNPTPITETTYTLTGLSSLELRNVRVLAMCNGKTSEAAVANAIIGPALNVPYTLSPTEKEAELFTTLNANGDDIKFAFEHSADLDKDYFIISSGQIAMTQDDWLFLPKTLFDDVTKVYSIGFNYKYVHLYCSPQSLEIALATAPSPRAVVQKIVSRDGLEAPRSFVTENNNFYVAEPGEYYIGIHMCTYDGSGGLMLADFSVSEIGSAEVPADPEVVWTPAPLGAEKVTVAITSPTKSLAGNDLDPDQTITYSVTNDLIDTVKVTSKPGQTVEHTFDVPASGYYTFGVMPSTSEGLGLLRYHTVFIGSDVPVVPDNLQFSVAADNKSVKMTWDPVSETGANGGYVNLADVVYRIYNVSGVAFSVMGESKTNSFTFTPLTEKLTRYTLGVTAENQMGSSDFGTFKAESLGTPAELPLLENFNTSGFNYGWYYVQENRNARVEWENIRSLSDDKYGSPVFNGGGMMCYNTSELPNNVGHLLIPKVDTKNYSHLAVTIRYWDYAWHPRFAIWARSADSQQFELVQEVTPARSAVPSWAGVVVDLPEKFENQGWVECRLTVTFDQDQEYPGNQYGLFDMIMVGPNVDYDLKVADISGPEEVSVGNEYEFLVNVVNGGREPMAGKLNVALLDEKGATLSSRAYTINRLVSGRNYECYVPFWVLKEYAEANKSLTVKATVVPDSDDEVPQNNERTVTLRLYDSPLPAVTDLKAAWNDDKSAALLSWSEPDLLYGDREDFETLPSFQITEQLGLWRNLDRDGYPPFAIDGCPMPNEELPCAWTVFNARECGVMNDDRLAPHSGEQYLMARSPYQDGSEEDALQASDWLISPEIVGGSEFSFWYGTISTDYTEYIELWYSSTDRNPESFRKVRTFSKSGSEGWEYVSWTLPDDAKYFALVYASYNSFACMIDDLQIVPAQLEKSIVDHYTICRYDNDDTSTYRQIATDIKGLAFTDASGITDRSTYRVFTTVERNGRLCTGPSSNEAKLWTSGIDDATALADIYGGNGVVVVKGHNGRQLALYDIDGKLVKLADISSDNALVYTPAGVYIAKIGNAYAKVLVK